MKLFGSIGELVSLVFRLAGGKEVKVTSAAQTGGSVTPAVPVEIEIPDVGAGGSDVFVTEGAVQTLTNKTIDANGTGNSITNLEEADFQTKLADANKVLTRNASGAVTSAAITNANVDAAAAIAESKLALSYSTSSLNSALDTKLDDFASINDSRVVLTSGTSGNAVKESAVTINGLGELSGATRLDVDNVRTDGNTISSTNVNGPLTIEAAGTATVRGVGGDVILDATDDAIQLIGANVLLRDGASLSLFDDSDANSVLITVPAALSQDRFPQIPDAAGDFVLEQGSQELYNKTINGNNNTLTVLAASQLSGAVPVANGGTGQTSQTAAFDALAPTTTQGDTIYHNGTDNVRLAKGSAGQVLTMNSGATAPEWADAGGGSGEKNYIENPSAASAITGWTNVGDLDVARTTTAAELPREYTTGSGIKITADTNPQSAADHVSYDFTLDDVDLNKKLKIEWAQKVIGGYVGGTLQVVITTQADRTTALHTPDISAIPSYDGVFQASFDSANTAALSLVIRGTSTDMATGAGIVISDVIVGPGTIQAVPALGTGQTYTTTPSQALFSTPTLTYQRQNDYMIISGSMTCSTVSGATSSALTFTLPTGITLNTSLQATGQTLAGAMNSGVFNDAGVYNTIAPYFATSSTFAFQKTDSTVLGTTALRGTDLAVSDIINFSIRFPVAQWAGAPNYAGSNDVEYAYNSGTWDAADTTSFAYGPGGASISGALTAARKKTVRFNSAIQATDVIRVQLSEDGVVWFDANGFRNAAGTNWVSPSWSSGASINLSSGVWWGKVSGSTTDIDVEFFRYTYVANDDSPVGDWTSGWKWRVVKAKAGAAVGFGHVTQNNSGLVKRAGQLLGTNTNDSAEAGNVGEYLTATIYQGSTVSSQWYTSSALPLTAGDWDIFVTGYTNGTSGLASTGYGISTDSGASTFSDIASLPANWTQMFMSGGSLDVSGMMYKRVTLSSPTNYYAKARAVGGSTTIRVTISARRAR